MGGERHVHVTCLLWLCLQSSPEYKCHSHNVHVHERVVHALTCVRIIHLLTLYEVAHEVSSMGWQIIWQIYACVNLHLAIEYSSPACMCMLASLAVTSNN